MRKLTWSERCECLFCEPEHAVVVSLELAELVEFAFADDGAGALGLDQLLALSAAGEAFEGFFEGVDGLVEEAVALLHAARVADV